MCGSGASIHTTSGGLYPSSKVTSLSSRDWGFVFAPSSSRVKILGNPVTLWSGDLAATPSMVSQVRCTGDRVGAGWKFGVPRACARAVGKAGAGAVGNVIACYSLVPVVPDCQACIGARLSGGPCLILCWVSHRSLSNWACKRETEDARALMISSI